MSCSALTVPSCVQAPSLADVNPTTAQGPELASSIALIAKLRRRLSSARRLRKASAPLVVTTAAMAHASLCHGRDRHEVFGTLVQSTRQRPTTDRRRRTGTPWRPWPTTKSGPSPIRTGKGSLISNALRLRTAWQMLAQLAGSAHGIEITCMVSGAPRRGAD